MSIPYGRQTVDDADVQAVVEVLRGDWLTQGPHVTSFEAAFAASVDAPYAVAFSSGTAALHGAAFAAEVGPGDDIVTSAMTFAASANSGAYLGARPVFADIERDTWNVSAETVGKVMTGATKAVIPVHFTGLPAPTAKIRDLVGPDVAIIEDAAHALGARNANETVGACAHADMAVFSFHPVKMIAAGEGGMVTTRDERLRDRLIAFRNHGMVRDIAVLEDTSQGAWYMEQQDLGFNYRLSDIHSALGESQLAKLRRFIERRVRWLNAIARSWRTSRRLSCRRPPRKAQGTPITCSSCSPAGVPTIAVAPTISSGSAAFSRRSITCPFTGTRGTESASAISAACARKPSATTRVASRSRASRRSPSPSRAM